VVAGVSANEQPTGGQVELRGFLLAQAGDGDQGDDESGHRPVGPVDEAAQAVGGDRGGEAAQRGQRNAAGGVSEDDPFLLERAEQAVQGREQVAGGDWRLPVERGLGVVAGDLAQGW
jgi:hypothetical protein